MKLFGIGAALALAVSSGLIAQAPVVPQAAGERHISLTGCVVKADKGYVLSDATEQVAKAATAPAYARTAPDPFHSRTLYWLDDDDELKDHAGQRVEVSGNATGKLEKGEIEVHREDEGVELEFKVAGKEVKVIVPHAAVVAGTTGSMPNKDNDYNIVVMKVDVKSVRKIADTCR
jgi:uncharacterized protein YjdB